MNKSKEIKTTAEYVKDILEQSVKARNSDNYLFAVTYARIGEDRGIDMKNMPVLRFFANLSEYNMPSHETIRRTRQKLQAEYPELAACPDVEAGRMLNEEAFKAYAVG